MSTDDQKVIGKEERERGKEKEKGSKQGQRGGSRSRGVLWERGEDQ